LATDTDEAAVRSYMANNNYQFPVALDTGKLRQQLTQRRVIPMTCLIDRQGRLIEAIAGEMFEEDVMELAARLMKRTA
ncbi:MAG: TlpA family protein disulfide reductase, partial [Rhodoferax sp.]|nr:TlpA family protein disulfide reductase [Rhodoferax sp.]